MNPPRHNPLPPRSLALSQALQGSESLAGLMQRVADSRARLAVVAPLLPAPLRASVRAGPLDAATWVLLVDNAAAAAKLRQMLPDLLAALVAAGWPEPPPLVKIQAPPKR